MSLIPMDYKGTPALTKTGLTTDHGAIGNGTGYCKVGQICIVCARIEGVTLNGGGVVTLTGFPAYSQITSAVCVCPSISTPGNVGVSYMAADGSITIKFNQAVSNINIIVNAVYPCNL